MALHERIVVYFSGHVQGVGFRFTTLHIARSYPSVAGFVKNLADGRVELVAEGPSDDIDLFLGEVIKTMGPYIRGCETSRTDATGKFTGFLVRY